MDKFVDACNATKWGLEDNEFQTVTNALLDKIEDVTMHNTHVREKLKKKEPLIRLDEEMVEYAFVTSQVVVRKIQEALAAAAKRKKAKNEEAKARKKAKVEEARNKPRGSNA